MIWITVFVGFPNVLRSQFQWCFCRNRYCVWFQVLYCYMGQRNLVCMLKVHFLNAKGLFVNHFVYSFLFWFQVFTFLKTENWNLVWYLLLVQLQNCYFDLSEGIWKDWETMENYSVTFTTFGKVSFIDILGLVSWSRQCARPFPTD